MNVNAIRYGYGYHLIANNTMDFLEAVIAAGAFMIAILLITV